MQSLIHGNFAGAAQKRAYALVGASAAIAAAVGPLLGGFITTYLSWRVGFLLEDVDHRDRPLGHQARPRRAVHRSARQSTASAPALSVVGMGGIVLGILVWQEGGESVGALLVLGGAALVGLDLVARPPQAPRRDRRCSTPTCSARRPSGSGSPSRCCSRSRSAGP